MPVGAPGQMPDQIGAGPATLDDEERLAITLAVFTGRFVGLVFLKFLPFKRTFPAMFLPGELEEDSQSVPT